jgi:tetratricopeptide (TPR) repeat protein
VAIALSNVARFLQAKGDLQGAEKTFRESLDIRLKKLSESHPDVAAARIALGSLLVLEKRFEEAEPLLREAHRALEAALGAEHEDTQDAAAELDKLYQAWGKPKPTDKK